MKAISLQRLFFVILLAALLNAALIGCAVLRPERSVPAASQPPVFILPTLAPTATPVPQIQPTAEQPENCTNNLTFISDLNYPDGTHVNPGAEIQKKWQVKNSGTCNWNSQYSLRLTGGDALGASEVQALIPARGGSEAILQINFTAPLQPGNYSSSWSAYDPEGNPFGDPVFIEIKVTS